MALLRGALNPNADASTGGGGVSVVDGSALQARGGPTGVGEEVQPETGQINVYVVKEGDTISGIAEMFDVTVNTIVWANDMDRDETIRVGQELIILPVTGVRYTVQKGDTLSTIAEKFGGEVKEISQYNGVYDSEKLAVGDELIIPGGEYHRQSSGNEKSGSPSREHHHQPTPAPSGGSTPVIDGYFQHPAPGTLVTQHLHGYNAIDFGGPRGTPIQAAADGTVIVSRQGGWNGGYGSYVVIRHPNGTQTLYSHNSRNIVHSGQQVVQGQVIGYMGSTGKSTGSHVHFEVRGTRNPFTACGLHTRCR